MERKEDYESHIDSSRNFESAVLETTHLLRISGEALEKVEILKQLDCSDETLEFDVEAILQLSGFATGEFPRKDKAVRRRRIRSHRSIFRRI